MIETGVVGLETDPLVEVGETDLLGKIKEIVGETEALQERRGAPRVMTEEAMIDGRTGEVGRGALTAGVTGHPHLVERRDLGGMDQELMDLGELPEKMGPGEVQEMRLSEEV